VLLLNLKIDLKIINLKVLRMEGIIIVIEEWRNISGYLNYQVSNIGRVRNTSGLILKLSTTRKGYLYLCLCLKGKQTHYEVHRLVALGFIQNPDNKYSVDHIDGIKSNNELSNLRWATRTEQRRNTSKQQATASSQYKGVSWNKDKNKWHSYIKYNGKQNTLGYFQTQEEAALAYNLKATEHFGEFKKLNVLECF
jgi:hypothetical protein